MHAKQGTRVRAMLGVHLSKTHNRKKPLCQHTGFHGSPHRLTGPYPCAPGRTQIARLWHMARSYV